MNNNNTIQLPKSRSTPRRPNCLLRSPIGYPGSKRRVVKTIVNAMPTDWIEFREPFAGGLSLSLYLMQQYPDRRFWVNDLDPFLSAFWMALAHEPEQLAKTLTHYLLEFPSDADKVHLAKWARLLIHETSGVERAALYYIMSKTAFAALAFEGTGVIPRNFNASGIQHLTAVGTMLKGVDLKVTDLDYADCLTNDLNVFTYFDPPYLIARHLYGENRKIQQKFDHWRFANAVHPLKSRWMVSYNDDIFVRHYFKNLRISTLAVPYTMRTNRVGAELLITNYEH